MPPVIATQPCPELVAAERSGDGAYDAPDLSGNNPRTKTQFIG